MGVTCDRVESVESVEFSTVLKCYVVVFMYCLITFSCALLLLSLLSDRQSQNDKYSI